MIVYTTSQEIILILLFIMEAATIQDFLRNFLCKSTCSLFAHLCMQTNMIFTINRGIWRIADFFMTSVPGLRHVKSQNGDTGAVRPD